ncbi:phage repressor protein [Halorubrum sp. Atlit-8R]|uniref:winged-helix domain-containing protein n=1 Tax=unclassified Halorubrum TaxID=2642239 RepID=UPI000EF21047|nr:MULTISPECIES: winged-helix domain-containing protein [unclassified Halorubrum]RLM66782.1 phage repressor protein [Halorubrum sp. Atlit-9R]RLM81603.1 phage repressor protein [Halorubrum sp. Atlit-8R]
MTLSDSIVLEFLSSHDLELPPKALHANLDRHGHDIGYSTVQLRLSELEEHGFVSKADSGYYQVTEKGQRWLDHELSEDELDLGE